MSANPFTTLLSGYGAGHFYGRDGEVNAVLQAASAEAPQSFRYHGQRTIGKTTLLRYLSDPAGAVQCQAGRLLKYGPGCEGRLVALYLDFFNTAGDAVLLALCKAILDRPDLHEGFDPRILAADHCTDSSAARAALNTALRAIADAGTRLLLCLDHFDAAFESMELEDDRYLRNITTYHALVIATERSLSELRRNRGISSPLVNAVRSRTLGLLPEKEARVLVERTLGQWDGAPDAEARTAVVQEAVARFVLTAGGRQPYLLALAGDWLLDRIQEQPELAGLLAAGEAEGATARLLQQLAAEPAVGELFVVFWNRLARTEQRVLTELAAGHAFDAAADPLAIQALRQKSLVWENAATGLPEVFSPLFVNYVEQHLASQQAKTVAEALAALRGKDRQLAEYLAGQPNVVCTFEELLEAVWGSAQAPRRGLEASVLRIRRGLKAVSASHEFVRSVRERGYTFVPQPE